jgi:hypothetical protein
MHDNLQERTAKLEEHIRKNPNSSTVEKEQLEELEKEKREQDSDTDVKY